MRDGVCKLLQVCEDIQVAGLAGSVTEALSKASGVDVVLSDYSLPDHNALHLIEALSKRHPPTPTVILSMHTEEDLVLSCIASGARGYLSKLATQTELCQAIRQVADGGTYLQPSLAFSVLKKTQKPTSKTGREELTDYESSMLHLIVSGRGNQAIADELHLSLSSVKAQLRGLFRKLDADDRTQAVVHAVRKGYLSTKDLMNGSAQKSGTD